MLYEMRTYDLAPGTVDAYRDAVREVGLPVRQRYGITLAGWYFSEIGTLNRVVHIWAFRDWAHYTESKGFRKDPQWINEYLPRVLGLIRHQRSDVMQAADFSPKPG